MNESYNIGNPTIDTILEKIRNLETRITQLESSKITNPSILNGATHSTVPIQSTEPPHGGTLAEVDEVVIESKVVEYGLAWIGSIVLLFGIIFLQSFTQNHLNGVIASITAFTAVAGVFFLSWYLRNMFPHLSFMLKISGHLLVYYIILRFYFFTANPIIPWKAPVILLLMIAIGVQIYFAIRKKNELLAAIGMFLVILTAMFSDQTHLTLPLVTLSAALSFLLFVRYGWWHTLIMTMILVYLSHIFWLLNNPLMGHPLGAVHAHQFNLLYLFAYGTIFSLVPMVKKQDHFPNGIYASVIVMNGLSFSLVLMMVVASFYANNYVWIFSIIAVICLCYSIYLKFRTTRIFDPSFFACFSFMAMSVAIYGYSKLPGAYLLLSLQSLLVVSWALWFRSKIIVVMNTILFIGMMLVYLAAAEPLNKVNFAFALTAFISARVLNWKKERLTLQTDMLRNSYLISLFFIVLFALYHAVPPQYVTPSWTAAALFYFIMSLILKNVKYRWMAIATLIVTAVYLFVVDLAHMEVGYRVIAFLFLAFITLGASLYFTLRFRKKPKS
ncbi:MAG: hypothetical protein WCO93_00025 [bacterium]